MNINPKFIVCVGILLAIIAPYIFTQFGIGIYFGTPNEIGGTIGGITSPIIGIMGAILVYLTFEQQNKAIQQPIELEKEKLAISKKLILTDLEKNILPQMYIFKAICIDFYRAISSNIEELEIAEAELPGFTIDIYNSIGTERLFSIFKEDVFDIFYIYKRVEYFSSIKPLEMYQKIEDSIKHINDDKIKIDTLRAKEKALMKTIQDMIERANGDIESIKRIIKKYPI